MGKKHSNYGGDPQLRVRTVLTDREAQRNTYVAKYAFREKILFETLNIRPEQLTSMLTGEN